MAEYLTKAEVIALLQDRRGDKTLQQFAGEMGISYQFLGHSLRGVRAPGQKMLKFLGLKKVVLYQKNGRR